MPDATTPETRVVEREPTEAVTDACIALANAGNTNWRDYYGAIFAAASAAPAAPAQDPVAWDAKREFAEATANARRAFDYIVHDRATRLATVSKHLATNHEHLRRIYSAARGVNDEFADTLMWLLWWKITDMNRLEFMANECVLTPPAPAAPAQGPVGDELRGRVEFLLDRLEEFGREIDDDYPDVAVRDWFGLVTPAIARVRSALATPPAPGAASAVDAIRFVEQRRDEYVRDHGMYDPETGQTEFPDGGEYVGELEEIIDGLKALSPNPVADNPAGTGETSVNASAVRPADMAIIIRHAFLSGWKAGDSGEPAGAAYAEYNPETQVYRHVVKTLFPDISTRILLLADNPAGDPVVNAPRVRELVWRAHSGWTAESHVGRYDIRRLPEGFGLYLPGTSYKGMPDTLHPTLEAAKCAAQADYKRRVLACLEPGQGWRDIASAPKGGSEILLTDGQTVGSGFWSDAQEAKRAEAGWFWESDRDNLLIAKNAHGVTRWQPLPPPPAAEGSR